MAKEEAAKQISFHPPSGELGEYLAHSFLFFYSLYEML